MRPRARIRARIRARVTFSETHWAGTGSRHEVAIVRTRGPPPSVQNLGPPEAMQFGRALQRVMTNIVRVDPQYGPCKLAKIGIADGFYRMWVRIADIIKLGVILPCSHGDPPLVAFPLVLPIPPGWNHYRTSRPSRRRPAIWPTPQFEWAYLPRCRTALNPGGRIATGK